MQSLRAPRTRPLLTGGLGLVLTGIMGAVLILGLRLAAQMSSDVAALQNASILHSSADVLARETAPHLKSLLGEAAAAVQRKVDVSATRLRLFLFAGVLALLALAAVGSYLQLMRARAERASRAARGQIRGILQAVEEGFFSLDADARIGAECSGALARMFGREVFAGVAFEELLQGLVAPETLASARDHIKLLCGEGGQENPSPSSNPLAQIQIQLDNGRGGRDTRHWRFNFHPHVGASGVRQVFVSVADVTASVLLARELAEAQHHAISQVDMLLGVMHVDPLQLAGFLDSSAAGLQLLNAILKDPARTDGEFRSKLDGILRELHAIKGEASALNLLSVAQRAHRFEDLVIELRERAELSGGDFLPLVLKLDELLAHLHSIRELSVRVAALQAGAPGMHALGANGEQAAFPADDLAATLQGLAARLARELEKKFRLSLEGLTQIPLRYRTTVRDVLIQMLRNSAVHGIEPTEVRRALGKEETGLVRAEFRVTDAGCELLFEDDGAGLALEELKAAAIRKRLTTEDAAARMDTRAAMGLIFRAGVSTCERATLDCGRGVGMDLVARGIASFGGKIVLSTDPGRFTRFKIALPAAQAAKSAVA